MRAIAITLALTGTMAVAATSTKEPGTAVTPLCMDRETREDLRTAMRAGIDQAMRRQTQHMFETWMKEPNAFDQPQRAISGMRNAVRAYVGARKVANEWSPPLCKETP
jgi:hypothetical protein